MAAAPKPVPGKMDVISITLVTACTALVSAVAGPMVSYAIAQRQIRANVISNNRERWAEALRDCLAEYVALLISASIVNEKLGDDPLKAVSANRDLLQIVERIILVKNKIMLMSNPNEASYAELCQVVEATYKALATEDPQAPTRIRSGAEAITRAGREVLRLEWVRVKRGE
jgi:hypothetical protein